MAYSPISFHVPFTIEDQLRYLGNLSGNYILDFRMDPSYSDSLLKSVCSYIYEGIPITKISSDISGTYTKLYNNKIMAKTLTDDRGSFKNHPWNRAGYQSIYSDLVIENSATSIPVDKKLEVFWMAINANYVNIDTLGNITSFSPLLTAQIASWQSLNAGKIPEEKDYFGTPGIIGYGYKTVASGLNGGVSLALSGSCTIDLIRRKVIFANNGIVPEGVKKVAIYASDSALDSPVIGMKSRYDNLDTYVVDEVAGAIKVPTIIQTNLKTPNGPLTGQAKPNWYIGAEFPDEVYRYTRANSAGEWSLAYPFPPYTEDQLSEIIAVESEVYVDENTVFTNEQIQTANGLDLLKLESQSAPGTLYSDTFKNIIQRSSVDYSFSQGALGGYFMFTPNSTKFVLSGLYVGRSTSAADATLRKKFLSYPGSIIQETGIEVFYSYRQVDLDYKVQPTLASLYAEPLLSVSAGSVPYTLESDIYVFIYENEAPVNFVDRYKIWYEVSFDAKILLYKIRWDKNVESQEFTERWYISWDSAISSWRMLEYYFRYEITLPKDRDLKDFYFISWDKNLIQDVSELYKISFETEQSMVKTQQWGFEWETMLIDRAVIKPFYIKKFEKGSYIDCISFQVYVDYAYAENFLANNQLYFYFSNPPKYELIQFDYNMLPYESIFLEQIIDVALEDRDDVPERYVLLGNYTVKDVEIANSFSLDIMADLTQMNEYRSYWVPEDLENFETSYVTLADKKSKALALEYKFRDDHHTDIVELDLVILTTEECCFTQKSVGSRCSPY